MRVAGHNVFAVLAAAVAVFAIGFLIYVVLFSEQWLVWSGYTQAMLDPYAGRMPLMLVMPFLTAIGMSYIVRWRGATNLIEGAVAGLIVGIFIAVSVRLYGYVYGTDSTEILALDSAHMLLTHAVAGAILAAWR
jgi:hypothetical protein